MAKKIGAIVSLSIIGILIIATIVLANIKIDYSVECANPNSVWVLYNSNDANKERAVGNENANSIINYINNASKENALTALFNGSLDKEAKLVVSSNSGLTVPTTTGFYVRYSYENAQKIKDSNNKEVSYDELVFTVNDVEGKNVVKVYVIPNRTSPMSYTHYYELEADFSDLYDFLVEKEYNV